MAFPTTPILDSFTRGDQTGLGSGWTGTLWTGETDLDIVSNQAKSAASWRSSYRSAAPFGPDCEAYCTWQGQRVFLNLRMVQIGAGTMDGYQVGVTAALDGFVFYRVDNESGTQLGAAVTQALTAGDSFGVQIIGSTIYLYYKLAAGSWSLIGTRTDSTYTAPGYIGIEANLNAIIDDFGGGTVGGAIDDGAAAAMFSRRRRRA